MRNYKDEEDEEDEHNYSPNELAELSINHHSKYRQIVESNLDEDDTVEKWEQRNLEHMQKLLKQRRS